MSLEMLEKLQMDVESRTIYLMDDIDKSMKYRLAVCMSFLDKYNGDINVYINSGGGCLVSSLAMFDIIKSCKNTVNGYVVGEACSGASLILQACDNRYISKHSSVMIHYGTHGMPHDIPKNNENLLGYYHSLQSDMIKIYKSKMKLGNKKITAKHLAELLSYDTWFRAKSAVEYGLVDGISMPKFEPYEYDVGTPEVEDAELEAIMAKLGIQ